MKKICLLLILSIFLSCSFKDKNKSDDNNTIENDDSTDNNSGTTQTRSFYMGFTPWSYAATAQAVTNVYNTINSEGDIIAHHFQQGIPFTASNTLDFSTYHINIQNEINGRINNTASGKVIYLAIDSLNTSRDDLTDLWDASSNMTRTAPWDTRSFDDSEVISAYANFTIATIERFKTYYGVEPAYFNYGTEISELMINDSAKFTEFVSFASTIYSTLKNLYPSMKLMVSIALKDPGSTEMNTAASGFSQIEDYVDVVGISTYGYAFYTHSEKGNPDNLPSLWLKQIETIAPNKSYAVTETGWIAESLSIPAYSLNVTSSQNYQNNYLLKLINECNDINAELVIWFTSYDFDTLWTDTLGMDDLSKIWKDTGLYDESLNPRTAYTTWNTWYNIARQ